MVCTAKVKERQDLHWTPLNTEQCTLKSPLKKSITPGDKAASVFIVWCIKKIMTQTWSYSGVLQGLQFGSALSGWLELRGKLSPCGGEGLVHISGYSVENLSNPPGKLKKKEREGHQGQITVQHGHLNMDSRKVTTAYGGYFGTLLQHQLVW